MDQASSRGRDQQSRRDGNMTSNGIGLDEDRITHTADWNGRRVAVQYPSDGNEAFARIAYLPEAVGTWGVAVDELQNMEGVFAG